MMDTYRTERLDNAMTKRVELHCHTKMSTLDSIVSATEIIRQAEKLGMDAIAITDNGNVQAFPETQMACLVKNEHLKVILGVVGRLEDEKGMLHDISLLVKNELGKKNLYKLISEVNCDSESYELRIKRNILEQYRDGILLGATYKNGEVHNAIIADDVDTIELERTVEYYDYLEICPPENNDEDDRNQVLSIIDIGMRTGKPVVAVGDVHYMNPEDGIALDMLKESYPDNYHEIGKDLYLRTTDEMLDAFGFLSEKIAEEVVITNTRMISSMIEEVCPIRPDKCVFSIEGAERILSERCHSRLKELYSVFVPEIAVERLSKELKCITENGYASLYVLAMNQCDRSNEASCPVGVRGGVAGSFVAYLVGITSINPLLTHYYCMKCGHYEPADDQAHTGFDLKEKVCTECGEKLTRLGCSIPFEPFGGFEGNKEPDIDLNVTYLYHNKAVLYLSKLLGEGKTIRTGMIEKTDREIVDGIVTQYCKGHDLLLCEEERKRIEALLEGVKLSDSIQYEGIVIAPEEDVLTFTPIMKLRRDGYVYEVSHFPYYSIDHNLTRLDYLTHPAPSMLQYLTKLTGVKLEFEAENTREVLNLFEKTYRDAAENDAPMHQGLIGIPELDEGCVLKVLNEIRPESIDDIIRIVSLAHSEGAWQGNAAELIKEGKAKLSEVISSRDDIMLYLMRKGINSSVSYKIMETVRKGRADSRRSAEWNGYKQIMKNAGIPEWYIESCEKIKYLFPRAHSVAYVLMSCQIALYKIRYPEDFRTTYFATYRTNDAKEFIDM